MGSVTTKKPRMLVTGANGMVGSYVTQVFSDHELVLTDVTGGLESLDVRNTAQVFAAIKGHRPDIVLHLAAATDVDGCELDPDLAYSVNAIGTQNIALACRDHGVLLAYVSTAGVFQGDKHGAYIEFDAAEPVNHYGRSKLAGERIVENLLDRYFIFRSGWMMGGGARDKKFVGKIVRLLAEKKSIEAVDDKFGNTTFARDLLEGIHRMIPTGLHGLYHLANVGRASRFDVARQIVKVLGKKTEVIPVSSARFPLPAPRARSEDMRNYKLDLMGLNRQRPWQEALEEYLTREKPGG